MKHLLSFCSLTLLLAGCAQSTPMPAAVPTVAWPDITTEAKPASRWWILGSAADEANITYNMEEYANAGLGGLEITPIYGVQGNDENNVDYLSDRWMELYKYTQKEGKRLGINVDMNNGTGWPFGGPEVTVENAATRVQFSEFQVAGGEQFASSVGTYSAGGRGGRPQGGRPQAPGAAAPLSKLMAFSEDGKILDLTSQVAEDGSIDWTAPAGSNWQIIGTYVGKTNQQVKRAAPGGEGLVIDHFSAKAVNTYLSKFDEAFSRSGAPWPPTFFNDSYEVYNADWTPNLYEEFYKRRGYKLEEHLPEFLATDRNDMTARLVSDYRETLGELLLENFTHAWTDWAHSHGSLTRNQAHGSPANLIDHYAAVDIPECEGFGMTDFDIDGLRKDVYRKPNDSDLSMLKYASSGAHISGKKYTSSETLTWLTEHFRTSLSQCKPDIDLMFAAGVNHMFFHGTPYSPKEAAWPGWKFYASINMSPSNPNLWRDASELFTYIARCQSFLQMGQPDSDFLVYLPVYDMWFEQRGNRLLQFDIHGMRNRAPKFISIVNEIITSGYDVDYISDNFIRNMKVEGGMLKTSGGTKYKAIIVPAINLMPADVVEHLAKLAKQGAKVVFTEHYPQSVPGYANLEKREAGLKKIIGKLPQVSFDKTTATSYGKGLVITGSDYADVLKQCGVRPEEVRTKFGAHAIRRVNETGYHYFIASLQHAGIEGWVTLGVNAKSAMLYNPLTGASGLAPLQTNANGETQIYLKLASGESVIVKTFDNAEVEAEPYAYYADGQADKALTIDGGWSLSFIESDPEIPQTFDIGNVQDWTLLANDDAKINRGVGVYRTTFTLDNPAADEWQLRLGDVRESARVRINGQPVATLWSVPYNAYVGKYLKQGENTIEVEVINLPANRIADYDRKGIVFRIFKDANISTQNGNNTYTHWTTVASGLLGPVTLTPVDKMKF